MSILYSYLCTKQFLERHLLANVQSELTHYGLGLSGKANNWATPKINIKDSYPHFLPDAVSLFSNLLAQKLILNVIATEYRGSLQQHVSNLGCNISIPYQYKVAM